MWKVRSKLVQWFSNYNQRNKLTNLVTVFWNFTNKIYYFCCFVNQQIDRQIRIVISHLKSLLIEINLSQIMTLSSKREKMCAVCPYLLFNLFSFEENTVMYFLIKYRKRWIICNLLDKLCDSSIVVINKDILICKRTCIIKAWVNLHYICFSKLTETKHSTIIKYTKVSITWHWLCYRLILS